MNPEPEPRVVRIGDHLFDRSTGEVGAVGGSGGTRLAPQPARLLELLIEKDGELATHDEIRERVWPETHVDFERSLHFCVRQIRAAFGESAAESSYVETLPRRGYRLARRVRAAPGAGTTRTADSGGPDARGRWPWLAVAVGLIAVMALVLFLLPGRRPEIADAPLPGAPPRLAIMPFELAAGGERGEGLARISEWLVAELAGGGVEVVGPRSTAPYSAFPFPDLERMESELEVDHVLNARAYDDDGEERLIVELIRLSDRDHPWAEIYPDSSDWLTIARDARDAVSTVLGSGAEDQLEDDATKGESR